MINKGDRVLAFDKVRWVQAGRDKSRRDEFFKPATVVNILVTVSFDEGGGTSHGHSLSNEIRPIAEN
jgi:hypothetical protein